MSVTDRSLTVAHLIEYFLTPTETFVYNQVADTSNLIRPIVLTMQRHNADLFPFDDVYMPFSTRIAQEIARRVNYHAFGLLRADPLSERFYRRVVLQRNVGLVHAHFGVAGLVGLGMRRALGLPLIVSFYGYDLYAMRNIKRVRARYRRLFDEADLIIATSKRMAVDLMSLGCPSANLVSLPICVDSQLFSPGVRNGAARGATFCMVSGFTEKKGAIYALRAFAQVKKSLPDAKFVLVGEGPQKRACLELVESAGLRDSVKFVGHMAQAQLPEVLRETDVFVHPSIPDARGDEDVIPQAIKEAASCGLPVVSTRVGAIDEVVESGVTGFLVEPRDVPALTDKMLFFARHLDVAREFGERGRARIEAEYSLDSQLQRLQRFYRELAK